MAENAQIVNLFARISVDHPECLNGLMDDVSTQKYLAGGLYGRQAQLSRLIANSSITMSVLKQRLQQSLTQRGISSEEIASMIQTTPVSEFNRMASINCAPPSTQNTACAPQRSPYIRQ